MPRESASEEERLEVHQAYALEKFTPLSQSLLDYVTAPEGKDASLVFSVSYVALCPLARIKHLSTLLTLAAALL